jgi:hypothetical protein
MMACFLSLDIMLEGKEHVPFTHMLVCTHTHTLVLQIEMQRIFLSELGFKVYKFYDSAINLDMGKDKQ